MNKQEFVDRLLMALNGRVSPGLVMDNVNYYEDYINTEIRKGRTEEEVLESLGDPRLIARFLQEIVRCYHRDYTIRSVTLTRHAEVFRAEGFVPVREWKEYVAMEYGKNRRP